MFDARLQQMVEQLGQRRVGHGGGYGAQTVFSINCEAAQNNSKKSCSILTESNMALLQPLVSPRAAAPHQRVVWRRANDLGTTNLWLQMVRAAAAETLPRPI